MATVRGGSWRRSTPTAWRLSRAVVCVAAATCCAGTAAAQAAVGLNRSWTPPAQSDVLALAVDPTTHDVYALDNANDQVDKYSPTGVLLSQFGSSGSGNGQFNGAEGIAVDASTGEVFVVDTGNHRVEVFSASGTYLFQFGSHGSSCGQFQLAEGVAVDPFTGDVYVTDRSDGSSFDYERVEVFDTSGTCQFQFGSLGPGNGQFSGGLRIAVDLNSGDVYVADSLADRIEKFDQNGTYLLQFGGFGANAGQLNQVEGLSVDGDTGDVYVADSSNARTDAFDSQGNYLSQLASANAADPNAVAVDGSAGAIYSQEGTVIDKYTGLTGELHAYVSQFGSAGAGNGQFNGPEGLALDPATSDVYVVDHSNDRVEKFDPAGNYLLQFGSGAIGGGPLAAPLGIAVSQMWNRVYVTDTSENNVQVFDESGNHLSQFGSAGTGNGQFELPGGITVDPANGDLLVTDQSNARIEEFDAFGGYLGQFGSLGRAAGQFVDPLGIVLDGAGDIWVVDVGNNSAQEFTEGLYARQVTAPPSLSSPTFVAVDLATNDVYVTDSGHHTVRKYDASADYLGSFGAAGTGNGQFSAPRGIGVDYKTGTIYVADVLNARVEVFGKPGSQLLSAPVISGTAQDGQLLRTTHGTWRSLDLLSYAYQWQRCSSTGTSCVDISTATRASYRQTSADVGHQLTAVLTATDQEGRSVQATATPVGPVGNPPPPSNTSLPTITGTTTVGQLLTGHVGSWSSPDQLTFSFQWQRCSSTGTGCTNISTTAIHPSYKLISADVGHEITVVATATDQENQAKSATAVPVGPVT